MKKVVQEIGELLQNLSSPETDWQDAFATKTIAFLDEIDANSLSENADLLISLLDKDFKVASTVFRLFLEKSKDEYTSILKELIPEKGMTGKKGFEKDKAKYLDILQHLLLREKISNTVNQQYTWKDIIVERLKSGRGSAVKGQLRGRQLEDFVENIVKEVYTSYDPRCSFTGMNGTSTEKADFAIPTKENPEIIIERKDDNALKETWLLSSSLTWCHRAWRKP